jgi:DNA-binding NtrC family response regulator
MTRPAPLPLDPFLGPSAAIQHLKVQAGRALNSLAPLLLLGETGVGKGVLARWLHDHGPRAGKPFLDLNCAGLNPDFLESELFGHERGAFTGADHAKPGLLEEAHQGTVFLDEIGDMAPAVQAKLLKVLEDHRFRRLGGTRDLHVDIRLVAATLQDLPERVRQRRFREDLFFRINILSLELPPLRQRLEDLPALTRDLLRRIAAEHGLPPPTLEPGWERNLGGHLWPGNLRELRSVLERAVVMAEGRPLRFELPRGRGNGREGDSLAQGERAIIEARLREAGGNISAAARLLGISRTTLYQRLQRYRLQDS